MHGARHDRFPADRDRSTNWPPISPKATSRARNGASAPSTRNFRSMSTATRRCPMAASAASAPCSKACSGRSAGIRSSTQGNIIGLVEPTGQGAISLEPGGQFELSGAPLETIHQTCREGNAHLAQVREIAEPLGIRFLGLGGSPKWTLAETPKMPKSRYEIMTRYMPKVGTKGLDMMYRTCTIQVNLDFESRSRHAPQDAGVAEAAAAGDGAVRQFAVHRRPAERAAILARRHLARHRQPALRPAAVLLLAGFRLCRLCRMGARRADVFRHPRRPLSRHDPRHLPPVHGRARRTIRSPTACRPSATGRTICRRCFPTCG